MRLLNIQLWPAELGILKGPKSEHCLLAAQKLKKKIKNFKDGIFKSLNYFGKRKNW